MLLPTSAWSAFCLTSAILIVCLSTATAHERFSEELLVRPLPGGKVLLHFHFTVELQSGAGRHHRIFPKAIDQLVRKFSLHDLELSFTQGRWDYSRWGAAEGITSLAAKPPGVELLAQLGAGSESEADATWSNLTHALSGIFCASVNALADPATKVAPVFSFRTGLSEPEPSKAFASAPKAAPGSEPSINPADRNVISGRCADSDAIDGGRENYAKVYSSDESEGSAEEAKGRDGTRGGEKTGYLRYGALPREAVCTENLTPWLKLLPCRDRAGLAAPLERRRVYGGFYHALRVRVRADVSARSAQGRQSDGADPRYAEDRRTCPREESNRADLSGRRLSDVTSEVADVRRGCQGNVTCESADVSRRRQGDMSGGGADVSGGILLEQTLTLVLAVGGKSAAAVGDLGFSTEHREVPLADVFGRSLGASCPLADVSRLYVEDDGPEENLEGASPSVRPSGRLFADGRSKPLLEYDLKRATVGQPLNITIVVGDGNRPPAERAPFEVSRFVTGHGLERGGIRLELTRVKEGITENETPVRFFQLLPWFIRAYFHTLKLEFDGRHVALSDWTEGVSLLPAVDRQRQAVMDLQLRIPAGVTRAVLSMEFDKGYLRISEHPPDGDRGFDLPSAVLTFPSVAGGVIYRASEGSGEEAGDSRGFEGRPLLARMKEALPVRVYTPGLLIPLATPDFSMPYNVITLTSTVIAMIFSSLFNTLLQKEDGNAAPVGVGKVEAVRIEEPVRMEHRAKPERFWSVLRLWNSHVRAWNLCCNQTCFTT